MIQIIHLTLEGSVRQDLQAARISALNDLIHQAGAWEGLAPLTFMFLYSLLRLRMIKIPDAFDIVSVKLKV